MHTPPRAPGSPIVVPRAPFRSPMSLDRTNVIFTSLVLLLLLAVTGGMFVAGNRAAPGIGLLLAVVMGAAWAMAPKALEITWDELVIQRRAWPALRVPRASIARAEPLSRLSAGTLRLFGVGGFFGSYGLFRNPDLGNFRLYATRGGTALLVRRQGAVPLLLTPDDVSGAIEALQSSAAGGASRLSVSASPSQ